MMHPLARVSADVAATERCRLGQDRPVEVSDRLARSVIREFSAGTGERVLQELRGQNDGIGSRQFDLDVRQGLGHSDIMS
jgi:hypothetical protein